MADLFNALSLNVVDLWCAMQPRSNSDLTIEMLTSLLYILNKRNLQIMLLIIDVVNRHICDRHICMCIFYVDNMFLIPTVLYGSKF